MAAVILFSPAGIECFYRQYHFFAYNQLDAFAAWAQNLNRALLYVFIDSIDEHHACQKVPPKCSRQEQKALCQSLAQKWGLQRFFASVAGDNLALSGLPANPLLDECLQALNLSCQRLVFFASLPRAAAKLGAHIGSDALLLCYRLLDGHDRHIGFQNGQIVLSRLTQKSEPPAAAIASSLNYANERGAPISQILIAGAGPQIDALMPTLPADYQSLSWQFAPAPSASSAFLLAIFLCQQTTPANHYAHQVERAGFFAAQIKQLIYPLAVLLLLLAAVLMWDLNRQPAKEHARLNQQYQQQKQQYAALSHSQLGADAPLQQWLKNQSAGAIIQSHQQLDCLSQLQKPSPKAAFYRLSNIVIEFNHLKINNLKWQNQHSPLAACLYQTPAAGDILRMDATWQQAPSATTLSAFKQQLRQKMPAKIISPQAGSASVDDHAQIHISSQSQTQTDFVWSLELGDD